MNNKEKLIKTEPVRYEYLDVLRGVTLISMILYHAMGDLVYIAGIKADWFRSEAAYIWQQSICWTFILLAGFCWSMGRRKLKRGCIVFGAGALITLVTVIFLPQQRVIFGVLTLLGTCMLLMILAVRILDKISGIIGFILSMGFFLFMKNINRGLLGIGGFINIRLPKEWYDGGVIMTFLGFTDKDFYSTDYFSLLPWLFLFWSGYFLYRIFKDKNLLVCATMQKIQNKPLAFIGRNSLLIYLLHQPVIYLVVMMVFANNK